MKISSFAASKYRDLHAGGDDTTLILPDLLGIFDGASSASASASGESPGKAASVAAAFAVTDLVLNGRFMSASAEDICNQIQKRIAEAKTRFPSSVNPATTMAATGFTGDKLRIFAVGDSGVRINGSTIYRHLKPIDDIWTIARGKVFGLLAARHSDLDQVEAMARNCAFMGLMQAQTDNILTPSEIEAIIAETLAQIPTDGVEDFLRDGIKTQTEKYGNNPDHPLGYSVLSESKTMLADVIDVTLAAGEVETIEIFSDGYFAYPDEVSVKGWEEKFAQVEAEDFNKIGAYLGIKGSTAGEFSDDRSLIVAELG